MDLREIGWGNVEWTDLAQGRNQLRALVNTAMKLWVAENVGKSMSGCGGFLWRAQLHGVS
jgi:hypothetical protein